LPDRKSPRRSGSSAGILMYRQAGPRLEVLLVHPGGPFWRNKDKGAWSIPKGEMNEGEDAAIAARREFLEETGIAILRPLEPMGENRAAASGWWCSPSKATSMSMPSRATHSRWNGRRKAGGYSPFLRSIAPCGSSCQLRTRKFSRASGRYSIG